MSLNYHLVKRPDMRKEAVKGDKLYYGQIRSLKTLNFEKFCDMVALRSAAFTGDVRLVIEGIISVLEERLEEGDIVQMGRLGNFRMIAGSRGASSESDFNTSYFKSAKILFTPGSMLKRIKNGATYTRMVIVGQNGSGSTEQPDGGEDGQNPDRPSEI